MSILRLNQISGLLKLSVTTLATRKWNWNMLRTPFVTSKQLILKWMKENLEWKRLKIVSNQLWVFLPFVAQRDCVTTSHVSNRNCSIIPVTHLKWHQPHLPLLFSIFFLGNFQFESADWSKNVKIMCYIVVVVVLIRSLVPLTKLL